MSRLSHQDSQPSGGLSGLWTRTAPYIGPDLRYTGACPEIAGVVLSVQMKISLRTLVLFAIGIVIVGAYIYANRSHNLPTGQIIQTKSVDIPTEDLVTPGVVPGRPQVEITTSKGSFTIELRPDLAPRSVINFLSKWANDYCDNTTFHRVEDWIIQGCDPKGDGTGGNNTLATETSEQSFDRGSVGVARKSYPKDKSNDSQFFVVRKDSPFLNGDYTYLGRVIAGMPVVDEISAGDRITSTVILTK